MVLQLSCLFSFSEWRPYLVEAYDFMTALFIVCLQVLEILSHVNKRVKHQPEIGLPLSELWRIYTENNVALIVRNFCILYIEMAFERIDMKVSCHPIVSKPKGNIWRVSCFFFNAPSADCCLSDVVDPQQACS